MAETDKLVLQRLIAGRFLAARRVLGRELLRARAAVTHQHMIGEEQDRCVLPSEAGVDIPAVRFESQKKNETQNSNLIVNPNQNSKPETENP